MGLPITGQVRAVDDYLNHLLTIMQHYNLSALAFYLGAHVEFRGFQEDVEACSVGFLIWVFPSMYISQKSRLAKYLGCNIVAWGIIMMLHSVPKSFGPFFVLRLLLGQCYQLGSS